MIDDDGDDDDDGDNDGDDENDDDDNNTYKHNGILASLYKREGSFFKLDLLSDELFFETSVWPHFGSNFFLFQIIGNFFIENASSQLRNTSPARNVCLCASEGVLVCMGVRMGVPA